MQRTLKLEKNLGLTEEAFSNLLEQLRIGNEQLFEQIFVQYFKKNLNLLKKKYKATHEDAYDCVMWALMRMRQMLLENKVAYGNLENYFSRIAVTRYIKSQSRKKEFPTEEMPEFSEDESFFFDEETLGILDRAWSHLGESCQNLLKGFYYDKKELKQLTKILGDSSAANTRKRKERCLKKLRELFFKHY
ncbi:MAG: hypothetical protein AAFZ15_34855 [Bacteroidota bacterium]